MSNKKKYVSIITNFSYLSGHVNVQKFFINKLSINFDKIFIINSQNLKFFPKIAKLVYYESKFTTEFSEEVKSLPKNVILFDPKNEKDFAKFLEDKDLLIINNVGRHFFVLKIYLLLKKYKLQQVVLKNLGDLSWSTLLLFRHPFRTLIIFLNQRLFNFLIPLLSNLGIIPKMEIRFLSNKKILDIINKNPLKKFLLKNKLLFAKEIMLVNSRSYDCFLDKKTTISEDYIVHLDASLDGRHEIEVRGKLDPEMYDKHYYYLERILKKLSQEFNKEVIVCVHPSAPITAHEIALKNFKVVQYKTRDYIYKSFLVTNFDSSAVVDAILLKKRIIGFITDFNHKSEVEHSKVYPKEVGYLTLNTKKNYSFDKKEILSILDKNISNYQNYISNYHCFEPGKLGSDKIIETIKKRFF